ncbi:MAG: 50S ribosomal protein L11 methyltransferase [Proteobacteria bacterium]|nr:50S ribosomal protein L11 methyltransferase [Pseudomonadota bacterium]
MSRPEFRLIVVRVPSPEVAEQVWAAAHAAGGCGGEERPDSGGTRLLLYAPDERADAVAGAAATVAFTQVETPEPVPPTDWSEAWKDGLAATVVSPRLVVRPSFVEHTPEPGQSEVVIDPGQAFGTGTHGSTRLVLEWLDVLAEAGHLTGREVVDAGTGSGVLALAALRLGAKSALGFDLDPTALVTARENGVVNGLRDRVRWVVGEAASLATVPCDLLLVNMLSSEFLPSTDAWARWVRAGGKAVFSGLLTEEQELVSRTLEAVGFEVEGERRCRDERGDHWLSLLTRRAAE